MALWLFQSVCGECIQYEIRHSGEGISNPSATPATPRTCMSYIHNDRTSSKAAVCYDIQKESEE